MGKKILCLVMAAMLTVGTSVTAFGEEIPGNKGWVVDFNGEKMNSNFDSSALSSEVYKLLPGDSIELQVGIKNTSEGETDWYMTNEILQSLEESQSVAEGGAYTYELTYVDHTNQETVLYSSETVGGEGTDGAGGGLHQATDSLEDYFYLDRLKNGESGTVHLTVALDGETQGNAYQDTLAKLRMNFAVEKVTASVEYRPGDPVRVTKTQRVVRSAPKTGDSTNIIGIAAVALVSGVILLVLAIVIIKKRKDKEGEQKS